MRTFSLAMKFAFLRTAEMNRKSDFRADANSANSLSPREVYKLLQGSVPGMAYVTKCTSRSLDKAGCDYWIHREGGKRSLALDLKELRNEPYPDDTLLLETSIEGKHASAGWAVDPTKVTDLYLMVRAGRHPVVLSARRVRKALETYELIWAELFGAGGNETDGIYAPFRCSYVLVPKRVLLKACDEVAANWRN